MKRLSVWAVFLALLVFTLSLTSCSNNETTKNNARPPQKQSEKPADLKVSDYFPLTAGSSWEYEGIGNEYAAFNREVLFASGKLAQIKEDNGGTVSTSIFSGSDAIIQRVYFSGETYNPGNLLPDKFTPNSNLIVLQGPLKVGTKWGEGQNQREISSLDISTDTPAGKFEHCLQVKSHGQDSTTYEYYSKDIGLVKREFVTGQDRIISQLKKYDIR